MRFKIKRQVGDNHLKKPESKNKKSFQNKFNKVV